MLLTLLFQMLFSVTSPRRNVLRLRHQAPQLLPHTAAGAARALRGTDADALRRRHVRHEITLRAGENTLAMLGLGTPTSTRDAGRAVGAHTTLENTPPGLPRGAAAPSRTRATPSDWASVVHLLTGEALYEELLDTPPDLAAGLTAWRGGGDGWVGVPRDDDENNVDTVPPPDHARPSPRRRPSPTAPSTAAASSTSAAWAAVRKWGSRRRKRYAGDRKQWSLLDGGKAERSARARGWASCPAARRRRASRTSTPSGGGASRRRSPPTSSRRCAPPPPDRRRRSRSSTIVRRDPPRTE